MRYEFRAIPEIAWAVGVTALTFALTAFVATDAATDWQTWLPAVGIGSARAAAGALLAMLTKGAL